MNRGCRDASERLWERVIEDASGCWLWTGYVDRDGYGCISDGRRYERHSLRVHRVAYEHVVGKIPEGMVIDHLCRVRNCVNPAHLEPVSQRENIMRGEGEAAQNAARECCVNGHAFTPENTYRYGRRRVCKTCIFARVYAARAQARAAA